ncbi:MAG: hypothetical protein KY445_14455, partial [Armatimonadetes bacterium]|nr:hypothetical protein [Armatimonadota bacterium]
KDEPSILFIEMINEPWHHADDFAGSVRYINALVEAVRSVGCQKLVFHNVSQDFAMAGPIQESQAQGSSFGWYPSGLDMRGRVRGNFLPSVDDYAPMRARIGVQSQSRLRIRYARHAGKLLLSRDGAHFSRGGGAVRRHVFLRYAGDGAV